MFYKYSQAKAVLCKFSMPHNDTSFVNAEYAESPTESGLSGFSKCMLMRLTGSSRETANVHKAQGKGTGRARGLTVRPRKLIMYGLQPWVSTFPSGVK